MSVQQFITDDQDPKTAEKVIGKLGDMLTGGEQILYIAVQKKPAVTLMAESVVITDRKIVFCSPGNLGLTTNFDIFLWKDIKDVSFKEEFFGSRFTAVPLKGENTTVDYIPKVQARKLYQFSHHQLEQQKEDLKKQELKYEKEEGIPAESLDNSAMNTIAPPSPALEEGDDEVTLKLKKLKMLFEKQLISQEEYETKKADILSQL